MPRRILFAGIGNIFLGDDAFGVEVARRLIQRPLPHRDPARVVRLAAALGAPGLDRLARMRKWRCK
jgi:Ni,Fe-hydrogenase maturation factor